VESLERGKWSKGLTKETNASVAKQAESLRACRARSNSIFNSKEYREKQSIARKNLWANSNSVYRSQEYLDKKAITLTQAHHNPNSLFNNDSYTEKLSIKNKECWAKMSHMQKKKALSMSIHSLDSKAKGITKAKIQRKKWWTSLTSEQKKLWLEKGINCPDARLRAAISNGKSPSKPEQNVTRILNKHFPKQWLYNGNGNAKTIIGGKIPDFININGRKAVIEVFGTYWHRGLFSEPEIINHYRQFGYDCLVIWEFDNQQTILKSLRRWLKAKA